MSDTIDFGIDLGTTNSSIASSIAGELVVYRNAEGSSTTPSVVHIAGDGRMLVGQQADNAWIGDPDNTQGGFKRWMGFKDQIPFPASKRTMTAEELSAEVLKSLLADARRASGRSINAAVITVPAAFGALQCDATARAARLAGLADAPLLQEPIAAAIAYGATPGSAGQRWMVFDLGGGTLDIAIISTRNDRLAILDHQGDNRLGGKDIDRLVAETILLPPLAQAFKLPRSAEHPDAFRRFMRGLTRCAERAKIALSAAECVQVELFDLGKDLDGRAIEMSLPVQRSDMEGNIQPVLDRCVSLVRRALRGARLEAKDLDRVLLVGGPTHMPCIRAALSAELGDKLDGSQDPMTVVARGAALYASTLPVAAAATVARPASSGRVAIELAYERASGSQMSPVAGVMPADSPVHEVRIDAIGGEWTSGWVPVQAGMFQMEAMLSLRTAVTRFSISARDRAGHAIDVEPERFAIAYMLPMAAPPLPHTLAVELTSAAGELTFDPLFKRGCPLPAETRRTYRADQTLRPSDASATLPIKFWEIEISDDPHERWWAGCVYIRADSLRRPIPEGSEIELTIRIDQSRKLTVEAFVPLLNQGFSEDVYLPDPPSARQETQQQLDLCFARLDRVFRLMYETERDNLGERARQVQLSLEQVAEQAARADNQNADPDTVMGAGEVIRRVRVQLAQLEEQLESDGPSTLHRQVRADARWTEQVARQCGSELDAEEAAGLRRQLERYAESGDERGLNWVRQRLLNVRGVLLEGQPWFWQNVLEYLKHPGRRFANRDESQLWIARADAAIEKRDFGALREAVNRLWQMQSPDQVELSIQQAAQPGLRRG